MMMRAELHIHSTLSGCADSENTIPNIINMGTVLDLDIMAISDHNSILNVPAAIECAKECGDIVIVPAMEVTTSEDIHVLCLFPTYEQAKTVFNKVQATLPHYPLNTAFYLPQRITDKDDNTIDTIPYLLSVGCGIGVYELVELTYKCGGIAIPAHVDKDSNGILAILGEIPTDLGVTAVEVSSNCPKQLLDDLRKNYHVLTSTDAHNLETLCSSDFEIDLTEKTALCLVNTLNNVVK
ncbi:MAG: hypothetical protein RR054_02325 [Clostridia bacterium]